MAGEGSKGRVGDSTECGPIIVVTLARNKTKALTPCTDQTCVVVRRELVNRGVAIGCQTEHQVIHDGLPVRLFRKGLSKALLSGPDCGQKLSTGIELVAREREEPLMVPEERLSKDPTGSSHVVVRTLGECEFLVDDQQYLTRRMMVDR
jgi:hypothetical protein